MVAPPPRGIESLQTLTDRPSPAPPAAVPLSARLRLETQEIHARAERTGIVRALLTGAITREAYALYLRNLLPAYVSLEAALARRAGEAVVSAFARAELYRAAAMEADLAVIGGPGWNDALPLLPAAVAYAARIDSAACESSGARLAAHAYVRYFGDLSGGQILARLLAKAPGLPTSALGFYRFAAIADLGAFKARLREAMDDIGARLPAQQDVVDEALRAFEANIALSLEIEARSRPTAARR